MVVSVQGYTAASSNEYTKSGWTFWFLCMGTFNKLRRVMDSKEMREYRAPLTSSGV